MKFHLILRSNSWVSVTENVYYIQRDIQTHRLKDRNSLKSVKSYSVSIVFRILTDAVLSACIDRRKDKSMKEILRIFIGFSKNVNCWEGGEYGIYYVWRGFRMLLIKMLYSSSLTSMWTKVSWKSPYVHFHWAMLKHQD